MQQTKDKPCVLVVSGPTASGKSETALCLAGQLQGEIISADSMQIYRGMDIGTAKVSRAERQRVPHHLIDIVDPGASFSVAAYQVRAEEAIRAVLRRGAVPVVCGGTGQYLTALTEGLRFAPAPADPAFRQDLLDIEKRDGLARLWQDLLSADPQAAAKIAPNDRKRIMRALEIFHLTGQPMSAHDARSRDKETPFHYRIYCLTHERTELYRRIDARVLQMVRLGLADEARHLISQLPQGCTSLQAIGYKEWQAYFQGAATLDDTIVLIQQASRRYAKRQLTWFRKMKGVFWLENMAPQEACRYILSDLAR